MTSEFHGKRVRHNLWNEFGYLAKSSKGLLPEFPRIPHVSIRIPQQDPENVEDFIGYEWSSKYPDLCLIEEKLDGANCAMSLIGENPLIRNRTNIINKGYVKKSTPAKLQFRPIWNWFYENKDKFKHINDLLGPVSIYGEWLWALHGIVYDELPDYFIAYEVFSHEKKHFINPLLSRDALNKVGFSVAPLLHIGEINIDQLEGYTSTKSAFGPDLVEGVCIKYWEVKDGPITRRQKLLRNGYVQGCNWSEDKIIKQKLKK